MVCHYNEYKKKKIDKGDTFVDIINIKLKEAKIKELLEQKVFYKAYHMNKKHWITIILDDTKKDEEILKCIEESYNLTKGKDMI